MAYGRAGYAMAWLHCVALRRLTRVAVVSMANRDAVRRHGVAATVVPNGVAQEQFEAPVASPREALRESLGVAQGAALLVTVGVLSERKQPECAIAAALELADAHILVAGDGPLRAALEDRYGDHPRVHLMGAVDDVAELLSAADVFVSMSRSEGLPNAVMEAMACGLPCVLSDIPPHREMLDGAEATLGELVPAGDPVAAGAALHRAWRARDAWGRAAHDHARRHYTAAAMSRRYAALYEGLTAPR